MLNVRRFPPPSSHIYQPRYIGARNPGGRRDTLSESPRCWGGSRCWGDRAAGSSGDRQWLPEAVVLEQWKNSWDKWLEPILFAVREVPQASTGFSPFELLYGRQPHGVLDVLRETWEEGPSESKNEIQHVLDLRTKLHTLGQLSMENLLQAQDKQSRLYNRGARLRKFAPGDKVLVLLPTSSSKLLAKWQGPFEVTRRVGDLNYEVVQTDRSGARQIYHLNLLKKGARWNRWCWRRR